MFTGDRVIVPLTSSVAMPYLSLVCIQSAMKINVLHLTGQEDPCLPFH